MTNINHNNRAMTERQKEQNRHIDYDRSHENQYLVQRDLKGLYQQEFGAALEKYNDKQKRADRKIADYYKHIQSGKKTALQQEMIIQVGDKADFADKADTEKANEILKEWFSDFENRNPNLKVYNAVIHNDEASPHMHLNFVPVADGYKRGLERQVSFDRAIKQQDSTLDQTRPFDDWREKEVSHLEALLKERGIERKLVGTNAYKDVNEYKEKMDELKEIQQQIDTKKAELDEFHDRVPKENPGIPFLKKETEMVKTGFMQKEEQETGNYVLSPEQYQDVQEKVQAAVAVKDDYDRLKATDLASANQDLKRDVDLLSELGMEEMEKRRELEKENDKLRGLVSKLREHSNDLRSEIKHLQRNIAVLYKNTRETLKNGFTDFRERLKGAMEKNHIENEFEKMHEGFEKRKRDRDQGMER